MAWIIGRIARIGAVLGFLASPALASPARSKPHRQPADVEIAGHAYTKATVLNERFGLRAHLERPHAPTTFRSAHASVHLTPNRPEMRINGVQVYGRPVAMSRGGELYLARRDVDTLLGPILAPPSLSRPVRTVVIDPGHGGRDHGNENRRLGLVEKRYTLDVARRLARRLRAKGLRVILTRSTDRTVELEDRVAIARRARADLLVSIHFNSFHEPGTNGAETFVMTPLNVDSAPAHERDRSLRSTRFPGNRFDNLNALLGYHVHRNIVTGVQPEDRGLKQFRYYVLRMADCPAVLVEPGFLSNPGEGRRVNRPAYREQLASSLASGVLAYRDAVAPGRK